jgi:hypothetical protein
MAPATPAIMVEVLVEAANLARPALIIDATMTNNSLKMSVGASSSGV